VWQFGKLPNGSVDRTLPNLDVSIFRIWKAGVTIKRLKQSVCLIVSGFSTFVVFGLMSNDRGAQYGVTALFSVAAYILAQRLFDYFNNYHACGEKLKLHDVNIGDTDRCVLHSMKDHLKLNERCKIAETLECAKCGVFCYIRTHDGL